MALAVCLWQGMDVEDCCCCCCCHRLAGRRYILQGKKSSKAVCVQPAEGLLHEIWLEVVNLDSILLDPQLLLVQPRESITGLESGAAGTAGVTGGARTPA